MSKSNNEYQSFYNDVEKEILIVNSNVLVLKNKFGMDSDVYKNEMKKLKELLVQYFESTKTGLLDIYIKNIMGSSENEIMNLIAYIVNKEDINLVKFEIAMLERGV